MAKQIDGGVRTLHDGRQHFFQLLSDQIERYHKYMELGNYFHAFQKLRIVYSMTRKLLSKEKCELIGEKFDALRVLIGQLESLQESGDRVARFALRDKRAKLEGDFYVVYDILNEASLRVWLPLGSTESDEIDWDVLMEESG